MVRVSSPTKTQRLAPLQDVFSLSHGSWGALFHASAVYCKAVSCLCLTLRCAPGPHNCSRSSGLKGERWLVFTMLYVSSCALVFLDSLN